MAEQLRNTENQEQEKNPYGNPEKHGSKPEKEYSQAEIESVSSEKIEQIAKLAESKAKSSEELKIDNAKDIENSNRNTVLNQGTYYGYSGAQAIKRIQKHLKPADRRLSKVIHNPKVEAVSDLTGGTIARPSGLLYGGIFSLITSLGFYIIAKHYGYEYPYVIGLLFFVGGFIFGLIVELLVKSFTRVRRP